MSIVENDYVTYINMAENEICYINKFLNENRGVAMEIVYDKLINFIHTSGDFIMPDRVIVTIIMNSRFCIQKISI